METFDSIIYQHVFRERNGEVDKLLKKRLELELGVWKILETTDTEHYEYYPINFMDLW